MEEDPCAHAVPPREVVTDVDLDMAMGDVAALEAYVTSQSPRQDTTKPEDDLEHYQPSMWPVGKVEDEMSSEYSYEHQSNNSSLYVSKELLAETRLCPIEVVLTPPENPDDYHILPYSWAVQAILNEVEVGDDIEYIVGFEDGRIEQVTFDDLRQMRGGQRALDQTAPPLNLDSIMVKVKKREEPEDDYEESGSDCGSKRKPRKRVKRLMSRATIRKSTRQASLHGSVNDSNDHGFDEIGNDGFDYEDDLIHPSTKRRDSEYLNDTARLTRSKNPALQNYNLPESDDELAQRFQSDGDSDDDPVFIRSDLAPPTRSSQRKKKRPRNSFLSTKHYESDSSIEFEPSRRSGRASRPNKSYRDPNLDDDYEIIEVKAMNAPKHATVKEVFPTQPNDSNFRRFHADICESCRIPGGHGRGQMIFCQGCSYAYHKECIGQRSARDHRVTKVGVLEFVIQCKFCVGTYRRKDERAPDHSKCQTCKSSGVACAEFSPKRTPKQEEKARQDNDGEDPITHVKAQLLNNAEGVLFRCMTCRRGYHFEHLPSISPKAVDTEDIRDDRVEEYSMVEWRCKDCVEAELKVHALVAWRPIEQDTYLEGQSILDFSEDQIQCLVKWEGRSHFHDAWMPGAWVHGVVPHAMRSSFLKRDTSQSPKMDTASAVADEWLLADVLLKVRYHGRSNTSTKARDLARIDDVQSALIKFQGLTYEEVVWDGPPPRDSGAPWDAFRAAYDEYLNGRYFPHVSEKAITERIAEYRALDFGRECELKGQPSQLKRGKLMEYQLEGVNYMLYKFHQQDNMILADEMGLGKTIQIVAFISALTHHKPGCWPFLVVVPNATCPNWRRELKQWAPDLRVVTYHGGKVAQDLAYRNELFPKGPSRGMKAHVVIMSYEAAANLKSVFGNVKWVGLIVDEGQRLKNEDTHLYKALQDMKIPCRILLTGTPLQNNKRELFNLLQFIDPRRNAQELDEKYSVLTNDNLPELHSLIRPYFLRRTKAQVLKFLPPMAQIILPVTMTVLQEKLSKSIMARNPDLIRAIVSKQKIKKAEKKSLNNILSDLRQCLCHPFCFSADVEDKTVEGAQVHRNLVEASPKLLLLNLMLPKLKERGHRVLIFSQFLHCLTIIEDFLTGLDLPHARIDGSLSALEKQKRIDEYNAPDSQLFAMLLSTRAGGVGINLATSDTVIIYDPDFNPHQDIQALSRAHRIGQKRKVLCFQLMTKDTVEEKIMQMGRKKMALDHALIESMDSTEEASEDLETVLKHGAAALFSDDAKDKITYDHASIDKLLDRSQIENTDAGDDESAETQFSFARVWANDKGTLHDNMEGGEDEHVSAQQGTSIWENILKERELEHEREIASRNQEYGRGARRRGTHGVDYNSRPLEAESGAEDVDAEDDYVDNNEEAGEDEDSDAYEENAVKPSGPEKVQATKVAGLLQEAIPETKPRSRGPSQKPVKENNPNQTNRSQKQPRPVNLPREPPSNASIHVMMPSRAVHQHRTPMPQAPPIPVLANSQSSYPTRPVPPKKAEIRSLQPLEVTLPNGDISPNGLIGGGSPCGICLVSHPLTKPCTDLHSEISLRIGIDRLRARCNDLQIKHARDFFMHRLQVVKGKR
ncbi:PHD/FYVE-zinc-finger like domain-containing protein [Xylariaceae sp. FL0016]|nr:PHD/FYVE-zinc-finger like domain-containing protein [Xylariaceae sp. FL0016]